MTSYDLKNVEAVLAIRVDSRPIPGRSAPFAAFRVFGGPLRFEPLRPTPSNSDLLRPKKCENRVFNGHFIKCPDRSLKFKAVM